MRHFLKSTSPDTILTVFQHDQLLWEVPLRKSELFIGRLPQNDIVLASPNISRRQAYLEHTAAGWQIVDLTSANGTKLAGTPITPNQPHRWLVGQPLSIDEYTLHLNTSANPQGQAVLPKPVASPPNPEAHSNGGDHALLNTRIMLRQSAEKGGWGNLVMAGLLILAWILALTAVPAFIPIQAASWLTFTALLITPGYLLADMLGWRLGFDIMEKLGLAMPLGIAVLAVPGIFALLRHQTLIGLATGWAIISGFIIFGWVVFTLFYFSKQSQIRQPPPWAIDEQLMLLFLLGLFLLGMPALTQAKMDGDALAVSTFTAEALAGLPLNGQEPLFGTEHGPGVRMIFNQYMPLSYLWSFFSAINPLTITAVASRSMLGFFALMATYMLGKAAGGGSRRFGLFTVIVQLLIYLAAPFFRADNVSIFFFERLNADKFMVVVLLLPPVFALALRFLHQGRRDIWLIAVIASFAASTIHPLSAAMLALALTAFGAFHLLLNLGQKAAWQRVAGLAVLVITVMILPLIQLYLARGETPLAPSYPSSFEGWEIEERLVPILPFLDVRGLDVYGRLPPLTTYVGSDANSDTNPFLVMRFAVNMDRQRLIIFDIDHYMLNPRLILEPVYLLALLLIPFLLFGIRQNLTAQFVVSVTVAVLFVMFNPWVTPLIGNLVMPWILWRFIWLLPYTLIISLALYRLLTTRRFTHWLTSKLERLHLVGDNRPNGRLLPKYPAITNGAYGLLAASLLFSVLLLPLINRNLIDLRYRPTSPYFYPNPASIMNALTILTEQNGEAMVLADQDLSVSVAAYVANANIVAHRVPTTSEIFPADEQDVALQRLIDQARFYDTDFITAESLQTLDRYDVQYVILASASPLDQQIRLMPEAFTHLLDDSSYSLYAVAALPAATDPIILSNNAMSQGNWKQAEALFTAVLQSDPDNLVALTGLAQIAQMAGEFDTAVDHIEQALANTDLPMLHYQLGRLYAERGDIAKALPELLTAQQQLPAHAPIHTAVGNVCSRAKQPGCAENAYRVAASTQSLPDEAARLIAIGDLWRHQGETDRAIELYQQAVAIQPTQFNKLILETAYLEAEKYDEATAILAQLRRQYPLSPDISLITANLLTAQGAIEEAVRLYQKTIFLQQLQLYDSTSTLTILAQVLLDNGRWEEAMRIVNDLRHRSPASATGHRLYGDLLLQQDLVDDARSSYLQAERLNPTQIDVIVSRLNLMQQTSVSPDEILDYLERLQTIVVNEPTLYLALGDQYQRVDKPEEAITAFLQALNLLNHENLRNGQRPASTQQTRAFVYARLAQIYETRGDSTVAMAYYDAAVTAAPTIGWPHVLAGDAYLRRNLQAKAMAHYETAIDNDPNQVDALVRKANLLRRTGEIDAANELYTMAWSITDVQINQSFQAGILQIDNLLASPYLPTFSDEAVDNNELLAASLGINPADIIRQGDENMSLVRNFVRLQPLANLPEDHIDLYLGWIDEGKKAGWSPAVLAQYYRGLGDLYLARAETAAAEDAYQTAVDLAEWWPEARLALAQALIDQEEVEAAIPHLEIARTLSPGSVETAVSLANAYTLIGNNSAAEAIFESAAARYPGHPLATLAAARYWQGQNDWEMAEAYYTQTLVHNAGTVEAYIGLADSAIAQGNYELADQMLQDALTIDQQNVDIYISLGDLAQRSISSAQALTWYQHGIEIALASQTVNIPLIDALLAVGDVENALILIIAGLEFRPADPDLQQRLARTQVSIGEIDDQLDQANYRIQLIRANYFETQGQPLTAIATYESALALGAEDVSPFLALSRLQLGQGNIGAADLILNRGLALFPHHVDLTVARANLAAQQNDPSAALTLLEEGLAASDTPLLYQLALARRHMARGDDERAEAHLEEAMNLSPESADVHAAFGELALQQGNMATAIDYFEMAAAILPAAPGTFVTLAQAYALDGRSADAVEAYDRALALAPTFETALIGKAAVYEAAGQWAEAAVVYEAGLTLLPTSGQLLTQFASLLVRQNEESAALELMAQAEQFAANAGTAVALAQLWLEIGDEEQAEIQLVDALQREPGSLDLLTALGDLYLDQANYEAAEFHYDRLVELAPGNPIGYLRLGNLANAQGDIVTAQAFADQAQQVDPTARDP